MTHCSQCSNHRAISHRPCKSLLPFVGFKVPVSVISQKRAYKLTLSLCGPVTEAKATDPPLSGIAPSFASMPHLPFSNENIFSLDEPVSRPATSSTVAFSTHGPQTTLAGASELHRKVTGLMQQAATEEEETKRRAEIYAAYPSKMSPFNWGKKAFVKATHAIRDRLNNHSTTTPPNQRMDSQRRLRLQDESDASSVDDICEDDSKKRLIRRIAEGRNLANPKIQTMVGDGNIPRKPLPVYESMRSRSLRSGSEEDPFSDGFEAPVSPYSQIDGKLDVNFNKHTHGNAKVSNYLNTAPRQVDRTLDGPHQQLSKSKSTPRFSNIVSGLAQHPNVMDFSSSPLGFSTPRIRLEPYTSASGPKATTATLTRSPSIIEFSFEDQSDDGDSITPSTISKSFTDGSQSVKRKSAQSDLRLSTLSRKKSKLASGSSNEDVEMAMGYSKMDAEEGKLPLSPRDKNAILKPLEHPKGKGEGARLTIFELGKETAANGGKKSRPRPIIGKRTSIPRPSSLFAMGRESRPGMRRLTSIDADMMDIDELQADDERYQVGGRWI